MQSVYADGTNAGHWSGATATYYVTKSGSAVTGTLA